MKSSASQQGVTLITLSILVLVAGIVMVGILPSLQSKLTSDSATTTRLNALLVSLRGYQAANGTLPCPADASVPIGSPNYGVAAANSGASGNCTGGSPAANYVDTTNHVAVGMLPVHTLGLDYGKALDGYGRDITYAVDTNATACWTSSSLTGQITVTDNGAANNTIAALVSHGLDGHGAWIPLTGSTGTAVRLNAGSTDADQLTNAHVNSSFAATTPLTNFVRKIPTATFDDLIVYKNPNWVLNNLPKSISTITAITPPANGTYSSGQVLSFTVTYSSAVTVTTTGGTPYLSLSAITGSVGTGNLAKATYQSGSGTTALTFSYTVVSADSAPTGLTMTSSITLNGGSISSGSACATTGFTAPNLTGVIVGQYIYVADSYNNRLQKFNSSGTWQQTIPSSGCAGASPPACSASSSNGQFNMPIGIAIDSSGNIWVADHLNNRVQEFNSSGSYLGLLASSDTGNGQVTEPHGIFIDASGNIWVADASNARVEKFNSSGTWLASLGGTSSACTTNCLCTGPSTCPSNSGSGKGQLNWPTQATADSSGNIWVVDNVNNRMQQFNSSGTWLQTIPSTCASSACSASSGNGKFNNPIGITIDSSGNIWVTDANNNRVQEFNSGGTWVASLGGTSTACTTNCLCTGPSTCPSNSGSGNGQLNSPDSVTIDSSGNFWVMDTGNNRVEEFNSGGTYLSQFGSLGVGQTQFKWPYYFGIANR